VYLLVLPVTGSLLLAKTNKLIELNLFGQLPILQKHFYMTKYSYNQYQQLLFETFFYMVNM
jgi:hypothetical protein